MITANDVYGPEDADFVLSKVHEARVLMVVVRMAVEAQEDGAVNYDGDGVERWYSLLDVACDRLQAACDRLIEKTNGPRVNWYTPLNLVEALAAALWGSATGPGKCRLDFCECVIMLAVIIQTLDDQLSDWDDAKNQPPLAKDLHGEENPPIANTSPKSRLRVVY